MKIRFSEHALHQLKERKLSKAEVEHAIREPEKVIAQSSYRYCAIKPIRKHKKDYLLIVIYDETADQKEIVTAFITSKIEKYL